MASDTNAQATQANVHNWRQSPHSQWAFTHLDEILPTELIAASSSPRPLPQNIKSFDSFRLSLPDGSDRPTLNLDAFLQSGSTDGVILLHHGEVVLERYFRGNDAMSRHVIMSLTKSICGLVFGVLAGQGKLAVDDLVSKYIPELRGTGNAYEHATIRGCLDMRSGVDYDDDNEAYRIAAGTMPLPPGEEYTGDRDLHSFITNLRPEKAVDDRWIYVSVNTELLGWVAERTVADGRTFAQLVQDLIWKPMGAESSALMGTDYAGHARAAGGMCATVRDLARLGTLLLDDDREIVPKNWVEDMQRGGDRAAWAKGEWASVPGLTDFTYRSCWLADDEQQILMGLGSFGQMLIVDRRKEIVLVKTASFPGPVDRKMMGLWLSAFREFQRMLTE